MFSNLQSISHDEENESNDFIYSIIHNKFYHFILGHPNIPILVFFNKPKNQFNTFYLSLQPLSFYKVLEMLSINSISQIKQFILFNIQPHSFITQQILTTAKKFFISFRLTKTLPIYKRSLLKISKYSFNDKIFQLSPYMHLSIIDLNKQTVMIQDELNNSIIFNSDRGGVIIEVSDINYKFHDIYKECLDFCNEQINTFQINIDKYNFKFYDIQKKVFTINKIHIRTNQVGNNYKENCGDALVDSGSHLKQNYFVSLAVVKRTKK
jgi:hypothetical protein